MATTERIAWKDAAGLDRQAARLQRGSHGEVLRRLILSVPLADGVRLAARHRLPGAPPADRALLDRLAAADERLVAEVVATAARDSCTFHPRAVGSPDGCRSVPATPFSR
ncbi:hypothetical protein ACWGH8_39080 [Nonomuraea muscovyensis]|uniref:Uncharacterized protein n=1 Tax=Nonomuraea muscovyensis TaxID=1124761 RepID=A0A7X0C575_9ACTN|nr:hypothetical protein [Nonomuraea muscovyensis]MBB6346904.1 hypothetical protein [Nonomuraea muscovyensis]